MRRGMRFRDPATWPPWDFL